MLILLGRMIAGSQRKEQHTGLVLWGKCEPSESVEVTECTALSQLREKMTPVRKSRRVDWRWGIFRRRTESYGLYISHYSSGYGLGSIYLRGRNSRGRGLVHPLPRTNSRVRDWWTDDDAESEPVGFVQLVTSDDPWLGRFAFSVDLLVKILKMMPMAFLGDHSCILHDYYWIARLDFRQVKSLCRSWSASQKNNTYDYSRVHQSTSSPMTIHVMAVHAPFRQGFFLISYPEGPESCTSSY